MLDLPAQPAAVEYRLQEREREADRARSAAHEAQQRAACEARRTGELYARQQRRARRGDVRVRGCELRFRAREIGTAHEHLRRQARIDRGHREVGDAGRFHVEAFGHAPDQHGERRERLALLLLERQQRRALRENGRFLSVEIQR